MNRLTVKCLFCMNKEPLNSLATDCPARMKELLNRLTMDCLSHLNKQPLNTVTAERLTRLTEGASEQTDRRMSGQADRRTSEQTDRRTSGQADRRVSEQTDRRLSGQADRRTSEQTDRRTSGQADRRTSEQTDRRLSGQADRRASEQTDRRMSGQNDPRTLEQIDHRKFGLVEQKTYEQGQHRLSDQMAYNTSVMTHHNEHNQITELAEHQAAHPTVDKPVYSESDQLDEEDDDIDDNQSDYGDSDEYDDRTFTSKEDKGDRVQSFIFETNQTDFNDSRVSFVTDSESTNSLQAINSLEAKFLSNFQAKDFSQRFPISTKLDYITCQEKNQDISEYQDKKNNQTYKRQFPSLVYQDPYQVSLQYMEKHNVLQIFQQITENLVYERPEDPLNFMLCQVQEMIKNRDQNATYNE
uniref:Testis expressed 55 n=1 Tax=Molossus molossus TaxID=27622 RepID=A0A7J8I1Z2_MOLMO|nr:testis expressed 55 [Molossus molossus]